MFVSFEQLPATSRIWIYQSARQLNGTEINTISTHLRAFSENWEVHGSPLPASFKIFYDQLIVLAAGDETSGCSIDTSVRVMKQLSAEIGVDLLDRTRIALFKEGGLVTVPVAKLKEHIKAGEIASRTLLFDNTIQTLSELRERWPAPAEETWLKRFFSEKAIVKNA